MKKIIYVIVFMIFLLSCDEEVPKEIKKFGEDIIMNPEKIYNLKNVYPNIYNEKFIFKEIMNNEKALKEIVLNIEKKLNNSEKDLEVKRVYLHNGHINYYNKKGYNLDINNCYLYQFCRDNYCLKVLFVKVDEKYSLFLIDTGVDDPYKEGF